MTPVRNLYVHAPFCARRCGYCDFAVTVDRRPDTEAWLSAIRTELETLLRAGAAPLARVLDTVYVGGGTPSLLDPAFAAGLARALGRERMGSERLEWTVEANPESFGARTAERWTAAGVNRISFGVQSFDPRALRWMGRLHSAADAAGAVRAARAAGAANLSVDLIFGLPAAAPRSWKDDLSRALDLDVPHVSLYGLTAEEGTPLGRWVAEGRVAMPGGGRYRDEYLLAAETLAAAGYEHYEVSSFARPGFASRHNRACWRGEPYAGLGNGAHSYSGGRRWWNERDWAAYARRVAESGSARAGSEVPDRGQRRLEAVWLALRTREGLDLGAAAGSSASAAGASTAGSAPAVVRRWEAAGLAKAANGSVSLTPRGWLALDRLVLEIDEALDGGPAG